MKIKVLKPLIRLNKAKIFELVEEDIPLQEILTHRICDIELLMKKQIGGIERSYFHTSHFSDFPEFTVKINNEEKRIKGIVLADSENDAVGILEKFYVEGDETIDFHIASAKDKREGIIKAFLSKSGSISIVVLSFDDIFNTTFFKIKTLKYKDSIVAFCEEEFEEIVFIKEGFLKVKGYKIPKSEYIISFMKMEDMSTTRVLIRGSLVTRRRLKRKNIKISLERALYYNGREYIFLNSVPSQIIKRFEKNGNMSFITSDIFGYNFLRFKAFVPFKKVKGKRVSFKALKNPFDTPAVFAFDSRVPISLPRKINLIDDKRIIQAFHYVREKGKSLPDFPLVHFHPSVKETTEFLLIGSI